MLSLQGQSVTVAGAGVLGLTTALRLAQAGARVVVCDPAPLGDNASGVAAGMLAPVFESVLDPAGGAHAPLFLAARDRWPALLADIGAEDLLDRSGAVLVGGADEADELDAAGARMARLGFPPEGLSGAGLSALHSDLSPALRQGLRTPEDWRIAPAAALPRLAAALEALGGRIVRSPLGVDAGGPSLGGARIDGPLVLATGAEAADLAMLAPELAVLTPVKGQILHFTTAPHAGAVVRTLGGYVTPQAGGAVAGATMEPGRRDRIPDAETLAGLRARAAAAFPHLAVAPAIGRAGVRAATPDGLPLVGRSRADARVVLCVGARRNGWLVAPLAAEVVLQTLAGEAPGAMGAAFDPDRFG